ncbi:hypothetical protein GXW82_01240 [Streptacidiphilus sp. 4-A2]|nr:hypothetical protein [Streptacidiphilus sp. 4-A2]
MPGIATLRAHTFYINPDASYWNPGCAPLIVTAVDENESAQAEEAVRRAAALADITVASVHWGDPFRPYVLTDCEPQVAQLLVDAGADIVLGHHQHLLRGTGFLNGRPVFYGLGNIACDLPNLAADLRRETPDQDLDDEDACARELGPYGIYPRAGYPLLPFHPTPAAPWWPAATSAPTASPPSASTPAGSPPTAPSSPWPHGRPPSGGPHPHADLPGPRPSPADLSVTRRTTATPTGSSRRPRRDRARAR